MSGGFLSQGETNQRMNKELHEAAVTQMLALYLLQDGDPCSSLVVGLTEVLRLVLTASRTPGKLSRFGKQDTDAVRRALDLCLELMLSDTYKAAYSSEIEHGLVTALEMASRIAPKAIAKARKGFK